MFLWRLFAPEKGDVKGLKEKWVGGCGNTLASNEREFVRGVIEGRPRTGISSVM